MFNEHVWKTKLRNFYRYLPSHCSFPQRCPCPVLGLRCDLAVSFSSWQPTWHSYPPVLVYNCTLFPTSLLGERQNGPTIGRRSRRAQNVAGKAPTCRRPGVGDVWRRLLMFGGVLWCWCRRCSPEVTVLMSQKTPEPGEWWETGCCWTKVRTCQKCSACWRGARCNIPGKEFNEGRSNYVSIPNNVQIAGSRGH